MTVNPIFFSTYSADDIGAYNIELTALNNKSHNPVAHVYTTLKYHPNHPPMHGYIGSNEQFFWGRPPRHNDVFMMIFHRKQRVRTLQVTHDDVIKSKHCPCYWPFVRGIHRLPVNSPHKGQ